MNSTAQSFKLNHYLKGIKIVHCITKDPYKLMSMTFGIGLVVSYTLA